MPRRLALFCEQRERNRAGHSRVSFRRRMQMVAGVECGFQPLRVLGIAGYLIQVNEPVEVPWPANPCISGFAVGLGRGARMVITRTYKWQYRRTKDSNAMR